MDSSNSLCVAAGSDFPNGAAAFVPYCRNGGNTPNASIFKRFSIQGCHSPRRAGAVGEIRAVLQCLLTQQLESVKGVRIYPLLPPPTAVQDFGGATSRK